MSDFPRVAAVHDLSGYGRCSLTVALPVLTAMGADCSPLLTAYLSSHTGFAGFTFADMTGQMDAVIGHWLELGIVFDALYSGFLGSARQIGIVRRAIERFNPKIVFIDPVMGDHGRIYKTYTPEMCAAMRELIEDAAVITPNLTEAAVLLGFPPDTVPRDQNEAAEWLARLSTAGRKAVITGLRTEPSNVTTLCAGRVIKRPFTGRDYHGTGDLFASVTLGCLLRGGSLPDAAETAADFVWRAAGITAKTDSADIIFAPLLGRLTQGRE
jgi:pyridoxine kinase